MKKILNYVIVPYFIFRSMYYNSQKNKKEILILDIDNTIADTWPSLGKAGASKLKNFRLFKDLRSFDERIKFFLNQYPSTPIVFLSNRNIIYYSTTYRWLIKSGFRNNCFLLILTLNVEDKIKYLEHFKNKYKKVIYYDDLSYNHENGQVKYYDNVISKIAEMKIEYYGLKEINSIN